MPQLKITVARHGKLPIQCEKQYCIHYILNRWCHILPSLRSVREDDVCRGHQTETRCMLLVTEFSVGLIGSSLNYTFNTVPARKAVFTFLIWCSSLQPSLPCGVDALRKGHSLSVKSESIVFIPSRPLFIKLYTAIPTASAASCTDAYMACQSW